MRWIVAFTLDNCKIYDEGTPVCLTVAFYTIHLVIALVILPEDLSCGSPSKSLFWSWNITIPLSIS